MLRRIYDLLRVKFFGLRIAGIHPPFERLSIFMHGSVSHKVMRSRENANWES
jgi:hypothetical protein